MISAYVHTHIVEAGAYHPAGGAGAYHPAGFLFSLLLWRKWSFTGFGLCAYTCTQRPNSDGTAQQSCFSSPTFNSSKISNLPPRLTTYFGLLQWQFSQQQGVLADTSTKRRHCPVLRSGLERSPMQTCVTDTWCECKAGEGWWPFAVPCCQMKMIRLQLMLVQCALLAALRSGTKQPREECFRSTSEFCCVNLLLYKQQHGGLTDYNQLSFEDQKSFPTPRHYVQFGCHMTHGNRPRQA